MFTHNFAFFLLLLQTPRAPQSRHPTCVVIHGEMLQEENQRSEQVEKCYGVRYTRRN